MPIFHLPLAPGEAPRLEVEHTPTTDLIVVRFDGQQLTDVGTPEADNRGISVGLPDGSTLAVRVVPSFTGERLHISRDGVLFRECSAHPAFEIQQAAKAMWFLAGLCAIGGLVAALSGADGAYVGIGGIIEGAIYAGLAHAAGREKRWPLFVGSVLVVLDTLAGFTILAAIGSICLLLVRGLILTLLVRAILAHRALGKLDPAAIANVFR